MQFNSWQFAVFFPVVATLFFLVATQYRVLLLLVASYLFYMLTSPWCGLLLFGSTVIDFWLARAISRSDSAVVRKSLLTLSLLGNIGILFVFKYFNFFVEVACDLAALPGQPFTPLVSGLVLPIGISFYTFQTMSYTLDVYQGDLEPEPSLSRFALYVSFFPQLVAGPIARAGDVLPQLRHHSQLDYARITSGLRLMGWGLFKKVVIADQLSIAVDHVYSQPGAWTGPHYVIATCFFSFQIYCDFSGYSDIAIGAARVLGVSLRRNFDRPYLARSCREFWSRWHISLSTWFRDYVYKPLGGSRGSEYRTSVNLMLVFLISGLWHGASWNYVVWGALHGVFLVASRLTRGMRRSLAVRLSLNSEHRLLRMLQVIVVFTLVSFSWIFFRAENVASGLEIIRRLPEGWGPIFQLGGLRSAIKQLGLPQHYFAAALLLIVFLQCVESLTAQHVGFRIRQWWDASATLRWFSYVSLLLAILNLSSVMRPPFLYFQF
jgi:alginate O-acetyltransferase complex protein AlgI